MNGLHTAGILGVAALCTLLLRALPFAVFGKRRPPAFVTYLGDVLPPAIMAALVIYCVRDVNFLRGSRGLPEFLGIAVTALLHRWKGNILLSIAGGTICYMFLVQAVF